jgi:hypothetical protein
MSGGSRGTTFWNATTLDATSSRLDLETPIACVVLAHWCTVFSSLCMDSMDELLLFCSTNQLQWRDAADGVKMRR